MADNYSNIKAKSDNATSGQDPNKRLLSERGLRTANVKPNLVRIEVLDGMSRQRYLGGIQKVGDYIRQQTFARSQNMKGMDVFYGFLKNNGDDINFSFNSKWNDDGMANGGLMGSVKGIVAAAVNTGKGAVEATGAGNIGSGTAKIVNGLSQGFDVATDLLDKLTGTNVNAVGSASLKDFAGVDISGFEVKCGWDLREQYDLCIHSLDVLYKMAYPRPFNPGEDIQAFTDLIGAFSKESTETTAGTVDDNGMFTAVKKGFTTAIEGAGTIADNVASVAIEGRQKLNSLLGRQWTMNPLPVRVTIGHTMDVEPMIIDGKISTNFSRETFVKKIGSKEYHLPIFCNVSIPFTFWMRPGPQQEFLKIFNREIFGPRSLKQLNNTTSVAKKQPTQLPPPNQTDITGYKLPTFKDDLESGKDSYGQSVINDEWK